MKKKPSSKFRAATPLGLHKFSKNIMAGKQSRNKCSFRKNIIRRNTREFLSGVSPLFSVKARLSQRFSWPRPSRGINVPPPAQAPACVSRFVVYGLITSPCLLYSKMCIFASYIFVALGAATSCRECRSGWKKQVILNSTHVHTHSTTHSRHRLLFPKPFMFHPSLCRTFFT